MAGVCHCRLINEGHGYAMESIATLNCFSECYMYMYDYSTRASARNFVSSQPMNLHVKTFREERKQKSV